jgi:uncharacterized protein (UPF0264 family)
LIVWAPCQNQSASISVAKLLVSVRSVEEARAAVAGGAAIIDVKEPDAGSLGRASHAIWREVRAIVPASIPVSVALGELNEWCGARPSIVPPAAFRHVSFVKIGFSHCPRDWSQRWRALRHVLFDRAASVPFWVAVIYADWQAAGAPQPEEVFDATSDVEECRGVLFDTWDKAIGPRIDLTWKPFVDRAKDSGRSVALAGSLDIEAIVRLKSLAPDIFAVRGAACAGGNRRAAIDTGRVAKIANLLRQLEQTQDIAFENNGEETLPYHLTVAHNAICEKK